MAECREPGPAATSDLFSSSSGSRGTDIVGALHAISSSLAGFGRASFITTLFLGGDLGRVDALARKFLNQKDWTEYYPSPYDCAKSKAYLNVIANLRES